MYVYPRLALNVQIQYVYEHQSLILAFPSISHN